MDHLPADYDLENYDFFLPPDQIAQHPPSERHLSRLMVLNRANEKIEHESFSRLEDLLPPNSVLVTNVSKVIPARMLGRKRATQGRVEFLLLTPLPVIEEQASGRGGSTAIVEGLFKPGKGLKPGSKIDLAGGLELEVIEVYDFGRSQVHMRWQGDLRGLLFRYGSLPLPPYIKRGPEDDDMLRYQTVYANDHKLGSVAAPTAGLHFTPEQIQRLNSQGHQFVDLALYVGYGTFTPIRVRDIRRHHMHAELMEMSDHAAGEIQRARQEGRPIVAVGTTAVRALESVYARFHGLRAYFGWTDLYMYPGSAFHVVDHMITNFHLPRSSLLLMVAAFAGRERIMGAYTQAVKAGYRFFSYGDAMFII
ncbi:MAG: tRNA preQ1(34) S-adenosylmethionine ribosyltransferase-isomerase QueA [Desulfovermiculus sp.]|nr:tRNA preQ1(34) S-adenosylmethionine ribosyltransferase-isomerase QueA [Desulfovermiculus sp.]